MWGLRFWNIHGISWNSIRMGFFGKKIQTIIVENVLLLKKLFVLSVTACVMVWHFGWSTIFVGCYVNQAWWTFNAFRRPLAYTHLEQLGIFRFLQFWMIFRFTKIIPIPSNSVVTPLIWHPRVFKINFRGRYMKELRLLFLINKIRLLGFYPWIHGKV